MFLAYMIDGSVMVTFNPNKVNTFVLLEMNCKIDSLGVLKSLILLLNDVMERYYIENTLKLSLCLLTVVGITAIRKLCRPDG